LGYPTAGFIYKLVAVEGRAVAKSSPGKATLGGRKFAWRVPSLAADVVAVSPSFSPSAEGIRTLQATVVAGGVRQAGAVTSLDAARALHRRVVDELPANRVLVLIRPD
jgi:nicotinate phosphoribosyltransferase